MLHGVAMEKYAVKIGNPGKVDATPFRSEDDGRMIRPERYTVEMDFADGFSNIRTAECIAAEINRKFPGANARVKTLTRRVVQASRDADWYTD